VTAGVTARPALALDSDSCAPASHGVVVHDLASRLMASLGRYTQEGHGLQSLFRVNVVEPGAPPDERCPGMWGRYRISGEEVRFVPHFPFEPGLSYRAIFDPRPLGRCGHSDVLMLEFSLPRIQHALPAEVTHISPTDNELPQNLLRFYVSFATPMQRGRARTEISLLGPNGAPAPDALYRAPIELWDRGMRCLTVLLDPGRLKRGVGPNRELGPPLRAGEVYTLAVGAGMTGSNGHPLCETVYKRFRVTDPVRDAVAVSQWQTVLPKANSRQPLTLIFPRPLDRALLSRLITVATGRRQSVHGRIVIDQHERRWNFTPASPWAADSYQVHVASGLEDVCGNNLVAAFDRAPRPGGDQADEDAGRSIAFCLA
jgi:hypothetical protein